jgi:thiamine phosphate synthase YjbQ (UPF0047 family)
VQRAAHTARADELELAASLRRQQLVLIDFDDRPRERTVIVQVAG